MFFEATGRSYRTIPIVTVMIELCHHIVLVKQHVGA